MRIDECPNCGHRLPLMPTNKQLMAYFLVDILGLSNGEAAVRMGVSRNTFKQTLRRFRKKRGEKPAPQLHYASRAVEYQDWMPVEHKF